MVNGLSLWVPTVLILVGILLNRADNNTLRAEMRAEIKDLRKEVDLVRKEIADLKEWTRKEMAELREWTRREISSSNDAGHKDALEIMRQMTALHERVAIVESKSAS